ncbi:AMP-binding protein [Nocardia camponoti]|uniref:AMP-dependent synthetase/ligase domain-containing protein n=1 Tax=Nocardia camponoti TaxID=1616106 RepID=A0A917QHV7_9NOCA|nr:AMP-binding protein [Nocardia camponoti]GGK49800.1 hypothetical protein GCM10011591_21640 [Nocardia camponoti]
MISPQHTDSPLLDPSQSFGAEPGTLLAEFAAQLALDPDALAVRHGETPLSYGELAELVAAKAAALVARGVGLETTVAIAMTRSIDLVVAVHAVLAAGGAFVLLDPAAPRETRERAIELAAPSLVLTDSGNESGIAAEPVRLPRPGADNPAYLVVDVPAASAVVIGHRAARANALWRQRLCGLSAGDSVLWRAPLDTQHAVGELLLALQTGAALVLADEPELGDAVADNAVTTVCVSPDDLAGLVAHPDAESRLDSLRVILSSGAPLPTQTAAELRAVSGATLWHLYGRAETAGEVVAHEVTGADTAVIPLGLAADDVELLVLDEHLAPVADGEVGQLYVSGVQLARGYLGRQSTAATFLANPAGPVEDRMFATGELVRLRDAPYGPGAELEFVGRVESSPLAGELVLDEFEAQAQTTPFDPAVVHIPGGSAPTAIITYGDLDRRTNQLARHLNAIGIGPESAVVIDVPRSIELIIAIYAVLKAGGAVVPTDSGVALPEILRAADPAALLTVDDRVPFIADEFPVVVLDRVHLSHYSDEPLAASDRETAVLPSHPAFILFGPGSARATHVTHAAAVNRLVDEPGRHFTARDVHLQPDIGSVTTQWRGYLAPLRVGATLVLTEATPDPNHRADVLASATHILDRRLQPTGPGVAGEVYLAGDQLAIGYRADPATTAARFIANPFGRPGERLFRTGGYGRWDVDGHAATLVRLPAPATAA